LPDLHLWWLGPGHLGAIASVTTRRTPGRLSDTWDSDPVHARWLVGAWHQQRALRNRSPDKGRADDIVASIEPASILGGIIS
jgi:hypothetical protein